MENDVLRKLEFQNRNMIPYIDEDITVKSRQSLEREEICDGCGSSQGCSRAGQGQFGTDRTEAEQGSHTNCKNFLGHFHVDSPFVLVCVRNYSQYNPEFVQGQSLF